jgi:hypothetical protein
MKNAEITMKYNCADDTEVFEHVVFIEAHYKYPD